MTDLSNLPPEIISQIASQVESYITSNREKYLKRAVPLSDSQRQMLQPFFSPELLETSRVCVLENERIHDPSFYTIARMMGIKDLPDFSAMPAVTFVDVIVSHGPLDDNLLFKEMVRVAQFAQLGTKQFAEKYVDGFLKTPSGEKPLLEKNADDLSARFTQDKSAAFSVSSEVQKCMATGSP
jgi:hypothetical protein